ncbi:MAG TPA: hypothetical protein VGI72_11565 [Gaiellales bacterium]|jgi:hypothetical protein
MTTHTVSGVDPSARISTAALRAGPAYQAFTLLRIGFTVAPIVFGLDKFFNVLVTWEIYVAPWVSRLISGTAHRFMDVVGVVEIAAWLAGIITNLLTYSGHYDVALRDFGLVLAAATQTRLASIYDPPLRRR